MPDQNSNSNSNKTELISRGAIALIVLISSIGGLLGVAIVIIRKDSSNTNNIFNALLPVFSTWVGTLLAFYFSKDNFEAATKSVTNLANKISGTDERLQQITVKDKMRLRKDMEVCLIKKGEENNIILSDLLERSRFERIPMLDDGGRIVYLAYKATIQQFISRLALGKIAVQNKTPANVTLADAFAADPKIRNLFERSFGFVPQDASLADAQREMERISKDVPCNDIFVTQTGKPDEAIIGWITDNTITENLKV